MAKRIRRKIIGPDGELLYPTEYLCAEDLTGKDYAVTIRSVGRMGLKTSEGAIDRVVMTFGGAKKKLILPKTCAETIANLYGLKSREWIGKAITIFPTTCDAFGDPQCPCIRVREKKPVGATSEAHTLDDDADDAPNGIGQEAAATNGHWPTLVAAIALAAGGIEEVDAEPLATHLLAKLKVKREQLADEAIRGAAMGLVAKIDWTKAGAP